MEWVLDSRQLLHNITIIRREFTPEQSKANFPLTQKGSESDGISIRVPLQDETPADSEGISRQRVVLCSQAAERGASIGEARIRGGLCRPTFI